MKKIARNMLDALGLGESAHALFKKYKYIKNSETRKKNERFMKEYAGSGGPPIPPPDIIYTVTGKFDQVSFHEGGLNNSMHIRRTLEKNGVDMNSLGAILDFGCGCGRVVRHWQSLDGPEVHGVDYNPDLIAWCKQNLTFANFKVNKLEGPLDFEDDKFDFIYAISVFTHLTDKLQKYWMNELGRILKPGGYMFITTHGDSFLKVLTDEEKKRYAAGELVISREMYPGTNLCSTHQNRTYVETKLAAGFEYIDFLPAGPSELNQDVSLIRKPGGKS